MSDTDTQIEKSLTPTYDALSIREKAFICEYIKCRVAWRAYKAAYTTKQKEVTEGNAATQASTLLKKQKIQTALQERYNQIWGDREKMKGRVLDELSAIALADPHDYLDNDGSPKADLSETDLRAVKSIMISTNPVSGVVYKKIEFHSKQAALTEIANILQVKSSKVELTGKDGNSLQVNVNFIKPEAQE